MTQSLAPITPDAGRFRWLALSASVFTFLVIVVGGIVRVTGSGLGCGDDWPLCHGQMLPPLSWPTFIELSHRFVSALVSPLILGTAFVAWRSYRRVRWIVWPAFLAVAALVIQILLGAVTVRLSLPPAVVALHLANALVLLALLLVVTVVAFQLQKDPRVGEALFLFDSLSTMAGATALGVYLLLLTGVLVTATRAGAACGGWPLCDGALVPTTARGLLHMSHRYAGAAVGLLLLGTVVQAWRLRRANVPVVAAATVTGVSFGAQVLVGALNVLRGFPMLLNGLHIALAATVWASAVVFAVLAMLYVRYSPLRAAGRLRVNPKPALRVRTAEYFHL